jgi:hypothetical protein
VQPELICIVASSTASERLSLFKDSLSQFFTTSWAEGILPQVTSNKTYHVGSSPRDSRSQRNVPTSPLRPSMPTSASKSICIACNKAYVKPGSLKRHHSQSCERELDWVCPSCPNQVFDQVKKLERHHFCSHADTCPSCYKAQKGCPSDDCKELLSQCSMKLAKKKAWGCPCCISWFDALEAWNKHKIFHRVHNGKVEHWSFSTMVRSLLQHRDLITFYNKYDLGRWSWADLGENDCQTLRFALERHVLPSSALEYHNLSHLCLPESLALYAYTLGTPEDTCAGSVNGAQTRIAADHSPLYFNAPTGPFTRLQPMNLNSQPKGGLEEGTHYKGGGNEQSFPNPLTSTQVLDCEESMSDYEFSMEFRSACGTLKTEQTSAYRGSAGFQQDPAISTYTTSFQKPPLNARTKRKVLQRVNHRKVTDRHLHAKHHHGPRHLHCWKTSGSRTTREPSPRPSLSPVQPSSGDI